MDPTDFNAVGLSPAHLLLSLSRGTFYTGECPLPNELDLANPFSVNSQTNFCVPERRYLSPQAPQQASLLLPPMVGYPPILPPPSQLAPGPTPAFALPERPGPCMFQQHEAEVGATRAPEFPSLLRDNSNTMKHPLGGPQKCKRPTSSRPSNPVEPGNNEILIVHEIDEEKIVVPIHDFDQNLSKLRQELKCRGYSGGRFFFGKDLSDDRALSYYGVKPRDKLYLKEDSKFSRFHEKFFHWDKARFGKRKQQGSTPLKSNAIISELSDLFDEALKNQGSVFVTEYTPLPTKDLCHECALKNDRCKRMCESCRMSEFYIFSYPSSPETRKQILDVFIPPPFRLFHLLSAKYLRWLALGRKTITYLENLSIGVTGKIQGKGERRIICFSLRYKCPKQSKGQDDSSEDVCFNIFAEFDFRKYIEYLSATERAEKKKQTNEEQIASILRILEAVDCSEPSEMYQNFWANDIWNLVITADDSRRLNVKETLRILFYDFCATCGLDTFSYFLVVRIPKGEETSDQNRTSKRRKLIGQSGER